MEENIMLTIYCLSFNHSKYLRKTLDGFISQKTQYKYEVILHDDASTDESQNIIKEYANKYPQIIKPIFQKQNQYSKGVNIYNTFIKPQLRGKYISQCEGDDFWCDPNKIELQISYLEKHPECSLCVANTRKIDESGKDINSLFNKCNKEMDYCADDVIAAGGGGLFHTSTFMYRQSLRDEMPSDFKMKGIGDYPLAIYLATRGNVHYFPQIMSKYRVSSIGSWSSQASSKKEYIDRCLLFINELEKLNSLTNYLYNEAFQKAITRYEYCILYKENHFFKVLSKKYRVFLFEKGIMLGLKSIVKLMIKGMLHWER